METLRSTQSMAWRHIVYISVSIATIWSRMVSREAEESWKRYLHNPWRHIVSIAVSIATIWSRMVSREAEESWKRYLHNLWRDVTFFLSIRRTRRAIFIGICALIGCWLLWRKIFPPKMPTSAVGCKNRLADVCTSTTYICFILCSLSVPF